LQKKVINLFVQLVFTFKKQKNVWSQVQQFGLGAVASTAAQAADQTGVSLTYQPW